MLIKDFIEPPGIAHYKAAKPEGVQQRGIDEICALDGACGKNRNDA